jgi:hypothetical protein
MAELGWPTLVIMQEHLQILVSQGYMTAVELATRWWDTLWRARRFMSEDLVHPHIDSCSHYCSSMAWNYII